MEASGAVGAIVGGAIGMEQGRQNNRANKKSAEQQYQNQRKLNEQGRELGLQMWKDTNYQAQVREMRKAGVSTGLIYGGGGAGGGTTNSGSGGSASMQAPSNIDIASGASAGMGLGLQMELMKAQKDNIDANTNKTNIEAGKLGGEDTGKVIEDTNKTIEERIAKELENDKNRETLADQKKGIVAENVIKGNEAHISTNTYNTKIQQVKQELINEELKSETLRKGLKLTDAQIKKIAEDIAIGKFNVETARNTLGLDKVSGTLLQNIVNEIYNMIGYDKSRADQKVDDGRK